MIIDFSNVNGGGGSGYTLPVATSEVLGGVMIGNGINVDSAGTISVEGDGIEVVTSLPESGTDGQMVLLNKNIDVEGCVVYNASNNIPFEIGLQTDGIDGNRFSINGLGTYTAMTRIVRFEVGNDSLNILSDGDNFYWNQYNESTQEWVFQDQLLSDGTTTINPADLGGMNFAINATISGNVLTGSLDWVPWFTVFVKDMPINIHKKQLYVWSDGDIPSVDINLNGVVFDGAGDYYGTEAEFFFDQIPSFTGNAFTICVAGTMGADSRRYFQYTSAGTYQWYEENTGTIDLVADGEMHFAFDGRIDKYLISDGYIKIIPTFGSDRPIIFNDNLWNDQVYSTGFIEYGRRGVLKKGGNNYNDFYFTANGQQIPYGQYGINIWQPPYPVGGNKVLFTPSLENMEWRDLPVAADIVNDLPPFADEGSFAIVNGGISYTPSNAFLAANTTNLYEKNNFNDSTELSHIGNGNYIYFDSNGELTTSTAKTFLFRIAMRTNENGDWNTSNLAYINVYREYDDVSQEHFYSWDMPPFDYFDDQGNDFTYQDSGVVDSSATANTTIYLPLWKWWDGTYGYKFYFEYDNVADTLKTYLYHSSIDQIQGENYGDVNWECRNHTKEFCEFNTDPNLSEVYVFKGGAWYKLGELTSSNV